ncbi:MAG: universal stress protein [Pseudanabaenaceae cyanobacterium]
MKIMVAVDGSQAAARAVAQAIALGGEVVLVTVLEAPGAYFPNILLPTGDWVTVPGPPDRDMEKLLTEAAENLLARYQKECAEAGIAARTCVVRGSPRETLCQVAAQENPDILAIGSRGLGSVERLMLGSVSDYVVHHAPCPVLVVR